MTDLLVVGAGPAGMAAALTATRYGANVTLVDNRVEPGGNIFSALKSTQAKRPELWDALGSSYRDGQELIDAFMEAKLNYLPSHSLWHLDPTGAAAVRGPKGTSSFSPGPVILATGALERPVPLRNWTLPGVMGVGAAQILLKISGQLPKGPIVIVGSGPLPLLYASQVLAVGGEIAAFIEPTSPRRLVDASKHLRGAWDGRKYLMKGLQYLVKRTIAQIPVYRNASSIQIIGEDEASGISFQTNGPHTILANSILLHDGVVPNVNPAGAAGLSLQRNKIQDCWEPIGNGTINIAGDAGGIAGAKSARLSGIAAAHTVLGLGVPLQVRDDLKKERRFRSFIDTIYPPLGNAVLADLKTVLCRCEMISRQQVTLSAQTSGADPNRTKTNLRCGMGPCQGRMCSLSVEAVISEVTGRSKEEVGLPRFRNPIVPVSLGDLANAKENQ